MWVLQDKVKSMTSSRAQSFGLGTRAVSYAKHVVKREQKDGQRCGKMYKCDLARSEGAKFWNGRICWQILISSSFLFLYHILLVQEWVWKLPLCSLQHRAISFWFFLEPLTTSSFSWQTQAILLSLSLSFFHLHHQPDFASTPNTSTTGSNCGNAQIGPSGGNR